MVNPHLISLMEAAVRAASGRIVQFFGFGCYAANENKHTAQLCHFLELPGFADNLPNSHIK